LFKMQANGVVVRATMLGYSRKNEEIT
jgi:hypothetical protein